MSLNLSLRAKISILFTIVLIFMTSANVYFAMQVLKDDKIAYIYEKNSSLLKFYSQQLQSEIEGLLKITDYLYASFQTERKIDEISEFFLKADSSVDFFEIYDSNGTLVYKYNKSTTPTKEWYNQVNLRLGEPNKIYLASFNDKLVINEKKQIKSVATIPNDSSVIPSSPPVNTSFTFHLGYKSKTLALINEKSKITEQFVILDQNGNDLISSSNLDSKMKEYLFSQYQSTATDYNQITTKELKLGSNQTFLTSTVSVSQLGLSIFSLTPIDMALGAIKVLLQKSILMSVAFISLGAILTLLLAKFLTQKLSLLLFATHKISDGDFNIIQDFDVRSKDEFGSLFTSFKIMSEKIIKLLAETKELSRLESELKTAKTVQETLLPQAHFENSQISISGYYEPASEVGGDIWGYYEKNNQFYMWLGDVTGHGTPAALLTSAVKSAIVIMEEQNHSPDNVLKNLNKVVYEVSKKKLMMTFFIACYDYNTSEFLYASAGQEPPLWIHHSDNITKSSIEPLTEANGPRLGQSLESTYSSHKVQIKPGDLLFCYTDGLVDIRSVDDKAFGERKITKALIDSLNANQSTSMLVDSLNQVTKEFSDGTPLVDDVTYFAFHKKR